MSTPSVNMRTRSSAVVEPPFLTQSNTSVH
jgi:hypothetical protein